MKVSDFLQMTLPLPKHEDLLEKGQVVGAENGNEFIS